ncbi:hypothetical protein BHE74_00006640 [Ensete ventricosum]|nr:hypothetical protein BHE74_00006640 [Ensete ventricosum]
MVAAGKKKEERKEGRKKGAALPAREIKEVLCDGKEKGIRGEEKRKGEVKRGKGEEERRREERVVAAAGKEVEKKKKEEKEEEKEDCDCSGRNKRG